MAINRLDRDTIINRALDLADSAVLDAKDRPSNPVLATGALSISWLQEALDLFAKRFPFSNNITTFTISVSKGDSSFSVPSDFILDYRNGILWDDDEGRMTRRGLSTLLNVPLGTSSSPHESIPRIYSVKGTTIEIRPKSDKARTGILFYYQLPAALASATVPFFPDDYILVHYVWIKAQEWHRVVPIGSALQYAEDRIADLQRSGIGNEAEATEIELDQETFGERHREDEFVKVTTT